MINLNVIGASIVPYWRNHGQNMVLEHPVLVIMGVVRDVVSRFGAVMCDRLICQKIIRTMDEGQVLSEQRVCIELMALKVQVAFVTRFGFSFIDAVPLV